MNKITVKEEHIKLLSRAYIRWEDCEYGAPAIDCKRPYGNSSVESDIFEILLDKKSLNREQKIMLDDGYDLEEVIGQKETDKLRKYHSETEFVLQIILRHTDKAPKDLIGKTFVCKNYYNWEEE